MGQVSVKCAGCGQSSGYYENYERIRANLIQYNGGWFCSESCLNKFLAKQNGSGSSSVTNSEGSAGGNSSGGISGMTASEGIKMAAVGAGAALVGVGAVAKGVGSLAKGAGSILGGIGKGIGSSVEETKKQLNATHAAEEEIIAINKMTFSSDPEQYKNEIWALFDKATSKPADLLRDTFVIKAAKKKLIHELDICKLKNPNMFEQFSQLYEQLTKKKKLFGIFG